MNQLTTQHGNRRTESTTVSYASHMPLDINPHWQWRNPLNIIPALLLLLLVIALCVLIVL